MRRRQTRARRDEREVHRHVILGVQPLKGLLEERGLIRGAVGRVRERELGDDEGRGGVGGVCGLDVGLEVGEGRAVPVLSRRVSIPT